MDLVPEVPLGAIPRRDLVQVWRNETTKENRIDVIYAYVVDKLQHYGSVSLVEDTLRHKCKNIAKQIHQKWHECYSSERNFKTKYSSWLDGHFTFDELIEQIRNTSSTSKGGGRPRKHFAEISHQSKRRRVQPLLEKSTEELIIAMQMRLRSEGRRTAAEIVKKVTESPTEAKHIKEIVTMADKKLPTKLTPEEALASSVHNKLSKHQYLAIHYETKSHNADIYPTYSDLLQAKKRCYPENIVVTEISAEVGLQSLLNHTIQRLLTVQKEVLARVTATRETTTMHLTAVYKWGCDGAAGHQRYKQRFTGIDTVQDDAFLFIISIVPIQILHRKSQIIWQNRRPSSTAFCRPIKIIFKKETEELVRQEIQKVEQQMEQLYPTTVSIENRSYIVSHQLHLTMIDGKICNYLTEIPSMKCVICSASPKEMNKLERVSQRKLNEPALKYGFSILHTWIKTFECILHIGYKLDLKKWQAKNEDAEMVVVRKKAVQDRLRTEMGILVDIPKPGYGTTNDGNTARRFFLDPALASTITGVDETLIYRLSVLLRTIACALEIDAAKFGEYAFETAKRYVSLYDWYFMPPTLHKLLIHGEVIIRSSLVPIGRMSEEAQESRHKDCKRFWKDSTRKFSRKATMEDLLHMMLITSDPVINSYQQRPSTKSGPLPRDVVSLLKCPELNQNITESDSSDSEDD